MDIAKRINDVKEKVGSVLGIAKDIGDAVIQAKVAKELRDAYSTLTDVAKAALHSSVENLSLQEQTTILQKQNTELKNEISRLVEWQKESVHYQLKSVGTGAFVYVYQPTGEGGTAVDMPEHWLCPQCYDAGKKSILQAKGIDKTDRVYKCYSPGCSIEVREYVPATIQTRGGKGNRFGGPGAF